MCSLTTRTFTYVPFPIPNGYTSFSVPRFVTLAISWFKLKFKYKLKFVFFFWIFTDLNMFHEVLASDFLFGYPYSLCLWFCFVFQKVHDPNHELSRGLCSFFKVFC